MMTARRHTPRSTGSACAGFVFLGALLSVLPDTLGAAPLAALPPVPVPADNPITPAKVKLGRMLYFEKRTSGDTEISCASCHDPNKGWGDELDISTGYPGTRH